MTEAKQKCVRKRANRLLIVSVLLEMKMTTAVFSRRMGLTFALACLLAQSPSAYSQAASQPVQLQGRTQGHTQGQPDAPQAFDLKNLRGKVVVVYAWATHCPVCISHMPELRANRQGWAGQPFDMISINTDGHETDIAQWHKLQQQTLSPAQRWPSLWQGDTGFQTNLPLSGTLPAVWVLDKNGHIKYHVRGRVAPEVWNQVAELL
ncbi:MAG: hypothetical protein RLZZ612_1564 [Pseudomonadota bacterium]